MKEQKALRINKPAVRTCHYCNDRIQDGGQWNVIFNDPAKMVPDEHYGQIAIKRSTRSGMACCASHAYALMGKFLKAEGELNDGYDQHKIDAATTDAHNS